MSETYPNEPKFKPRMPMPVCWGFEAGVIRVAWTREPPFTITGREGQVRTAVITEIHTDREQLRSESVTAALVGLVVRSPDGVLSRIAGVEMFCTISQHCGTPIGLLLEQMEEP